MSSDVSVIIPAYNSEEFIEEAIRSVLLQSELPVEILVVDDGSTDNTAAIARAFGEPVRVLSIENRGVAVARNHGLASATGNYIAFLDSDDVWEAEKLQKQLNALTATSRFIYTDTVSFGRPAMEGLRMSGGRKLPSGNILKSLAQGNFVATSSVLAETSLLRSAGGFSTEFRIGEDWLLWLELARRTEATYIDEPLVRYRIRSGSLSSDLEQRLQCETRIIERAVTWLDCCSPRAKQTLRLRAMAGAYSYAALLAFSDNELALARRYSMAAFRLHPSGTAVKQYFKAVLGHRWVARLTALKRSLRPM